ncbi:D-tyrosyl-tRNA(Tyr) deacylase [Hamiltosporidium tvaerminnensis]|uniref:D-aminoacyl-tRNA deacylase n=1 Tax=Hamiltosporidium tvaerminnensis TaxID=1176355 RepID=A0A4Q9LTT9_9MICR|nr:D-tyrosyl-tRNA(Tyr) deacylase [Hamiltosporidium tvaerminnensis]TBT99999.1 D-tyrosyl-tRNA(Tyr) deacylase [Hamiltosporidium tvaerminnensis]TBU12029.1 D-tyrosyl-tRNA(Tyr) deacylase [Hamiltosporidium tvaerminnensis]
MKIVLQKVKNAVVYMNGEIISSIGYGYALLVGIQKNDNEDKIEWIVNKILKMRLFNEWKNNIVDVNGEILVLSQFTLFARFEGNKPDFHLAEKRDIANTYIKKVIETFKNKYSILKIKEGCFGEKLEIHLVNDGPTTILIEK